MVLLSSTEGVTRDLDIPCSQSIRSFASHSQGQSIVTLPVKPLILVDVSNGSALILFLPHFLPLDRPWEVCDGDDEEAVMHRISAGLLVYHPYMKSIDKEERWVTHLFESSAIPANALYHARNAASSPKKPPALMIGTVGFPFALRCRYPIPSSKKVRSRVKKRRKKAMVERRVATRRIVVKMNQP